MGLGPWVSLALAADAWERHRVRKGQLRQDLLLRPVWPQRRLQGLLAIQVPASLQRVQLSVSVMLGLAHSRILKSLSHTGHAMGCVPGECVVFLGAGGVQMTVLALKPEPEHCVVSLTQTRCVASFRCDL